MAQRVQVSSFESCEAFNRQIGGSMVQPDGMMSPFRSLEDKFEGADIRSLEPAFADQSSGPVKYNSIFSESLFSHKESGQELNMPEHQNSNQVLQN